MTHGKKSKTIYTDLKYNRYMTDDRNRKSGNTISKFCNNEASTSHEKKSKTIYTDMKYNRYMTDDRNRKSGNTISKFCIHDNCNKEAIYNFWGMEPKYCIDHKKDYYVNIYKNPVSKFCDYNNCEKTAIYNFWGMRPRYCFDHKDKLHVNIPKKHKLCYKHYISHSPKTKCPKCKIKKSPKCDECNITASYNFPKSRPLKCLKHRKKGMVNIKRKHILCEVHDISHSKKVECKKCKLDIDNYDNSSKYMKNKIYKQYKNDLMENINKKFKNHDPKTILQNILNNSKNEKITKFKKIRSERKKKRKNKDKIYKCKICSDNLSVNIDHFNSKEHIDNFNNNIKLTINKSIKEKFIDIIFKFKITNEGSFLNDLHFKKIAKQEINKNMDKNKKYKYSITFYKGFSDNITNKLTDGNYTYNPINIIEAINNNYNDIHMFNTSKTVDTSHEQPTKTRQDELIRKEKARYNRIKENELYKKNIEDNKVKEWLIKNKEFKEEQITDKLIEDSKKDYFDNTQEEIDINYREESYCDKPQTNSGGTSTKLYEYGVTYKLTEYTPISGGSEFNKVPELFITKRSLIVLKNNDNKCFLYCYIREFLNPITEKRFRITKKDKELANKIINETNLDFENVSINEIDKIEKKLQVNVNVFSCDKKYKNKNPVRKSRTNYDRTLDLLLIEGINHYIIIDNIHCFLSNRGNEKDVFVCRTCLNTFYSENKYNEHINYCKNRKPQRLMPANEKHIKFNKLQNCMLNNFIIYSDFECIIDKNNEHKFISGGYLVKCRNDKFTKPVQLFDNLDDYCKNLKNELDYIETINDKHLNYRIDMKTFDKEKFDNTTNCEYCDYKFDKDYNDRKIELYERVDKNKLKWIIDNYEFNEETENTLKLYYDSLNNKGQKKVIYKQSKEDKNRYFGGICLTTIKRIVRNSIIPNNILDIDMENSHPRILLYLCEKHKIDCTNLIEYIDNREYFLNKISNNRKKSKTLILQMLNGGFKNKYSDDKFTNDFLKDFELEIKNIQNKIYEIDNRFNDKTIYNYKGKSLSRILLELENKILQVMVDFFKFKNIQIFTLEYDGLKIINDPDKTISLKQLEFIIKMKTGIEMKLTIKEIKDEFTEYETNVNTDNLPKNIIISKNKKVIHHDHCLPKNNILGYICQNCNLQIKNKKEIPIIFHNGMNYDNSILLNGMSKLNPVISCIGITSEKFKSIEFKFKKYEMDDDGEAHEIKSNYSLRVIDSYNMIMGSLNSLSTNLNNKYKYETKKEFKDNFEIINKKMNFPYEWINENNLDNKDLPEIKDFYSSLKLETISEEEYKQTKEIYNKLKFKNIKEYLDTYLKLDITLLTDIFEKFRKGIWDKFGLDCSKYVSSPSLSKDCMLKFTKIKIEHIKDIEMYDFINNSVIGGLCVCSNPYLNNDNSSSTIAYQDVSSLYPAIMRNKIPLKNYKFIELNEFNINKYGEDKNYSCILLCHVKTTDKVKNDHILKQFPALISKTSICYDNLSDYQKTNLKENYKSSGKLINHLGSDENNYLSFEMYKLLLELGYEIEIKKILEYYHSDFMKKYIDFLYDKKTEYKKIGDKSMMMTYKILMNSLYGSMLTRVENFRDFKIVTNSKQADFYTKRSNFNSRVIINEDLTIVEMNKIKCVYNSPILIGSIILQNSKVLLFDYMYNKFPKLFGKENIQIGYVDTDSIIFKIENMKNEEYQNIQNNNPDIFGCKIGLMENEIDKNDEITEYIGLSSKCYSYITKNNLKDNVKTKGISESYKSKYLNHQEFRKVLFDNVNLNKVEFNSIKIKNQKIFTNKIIKDNVKNFNDKRFMIDKFKSIPFELNL